MLTAPNSSNALQRPMDSQARNVVSSEKESGAGVAAGTGNQIVASSAGADSPAVEAKAGEMPGGGASGTGVVVNPVAPASKKGPIPEPLVASVREPLVATGAAQGYPDDIEINSAVANAPPSPPLSAASETN